MENTIIIDLKDSLSAHGFSHNNQIHQSDLEKAINLIKEQLSQTKDIKEGSVFLKHEYHTIGVFGDRGSGKTSFLISLLEKCKKDFNNVEVLKMLDPTLIEHKKPIILCIISMINQTVEEKLRKDECSVDTASYEMRRIWESVLKDVSAGLYAIEKVGKGYDDSLWQDEEYVMHIGLNKIDKANNFEESLRRMIGTALNIIKKDAFIISFDDIDVDVYQGWNVLETLRRYLSDKRIISIISGNIRLFNMIVRKELCKNVLADDYKSNPVMANELESQYMLKLLNPSNRINLISLFNLLQYKNHKFKIKFNEDTPEDIIVCYNTYLQSKNICDHSSKKTFRDFFLSMSLRSQIHFLRNIHDEENNNPLDVFASRLYAEDMDIELLSQQAQITNISILKYLKEKGNLPDCYLLLPTLSNKDINSNFTALTFILCNHFANAPHAMFDYMLRIGFIRNIIQPIEKSEITNNMFKYAGWYQVMSLKNNIGLTMAFFKGEGKEHISMSATELKSKKPLTNAFDKVLKEEKNEMVRLVAMFPFINLSYSDKNESRNYYSIFVLLAVLCELLKCNDKHDMAERINDMKLFRSYQMPQEETSSINDPEIEPEDYGITVNEETVNELANKVLLWKESYNKSFVPPYVIGRILTRLYKSVLNIERGNVGEMMNLSIASFFNSCLVEESRLKDHEKVNTINNNNPRKNTDVFKNNLAKKDIVNILPFTKWIMSCPILNCFLNRELCDEINQYIESIKPEISDNLFSENPLKIDITAYDMLSKISSKDDSKTLYVFSGKKGKEIQKTINLLLKILTEEEIKEKILDEKDLEKVKNFIDALGIFEKMKNTNPITSFQKNYYLDGNSSKINELGK